MKKTQIITHKRHQLLNEAKRNPKSAYDMALDLEKKHGSQSIIQHYFYLSASGGYVPAMIRVACLYLSGQYIKFDEDGRACFVRDHTKGVEWLTKAASTGDDTSHHLLARCYLDGIGVPKSEYEPRFHISRIKITSNNNNLHELNGSMIIGNASGKLQEIIEKL